MKYFIVLLISIFVFTNDSCAFMKEKSITESDFPAAKMEETQEFKVDWDSFMKVVDEGYHVKKTDKENDLDTILNAISEFNSYNVDDELDSYEKETTSNEH